MTTEAEVLSAGDPAHPPTVSVVVPMYNAARFIEQCVASVQAQTVSDWELLIVDDGSTDESLAIATRFADQDARLRVLPVQPGTPRGVSRARQRGVDRARGEFVAFLDADDVFFPEKIERQVSALRNQPECVLCHTAVLAKGNDSEHVTLQQAHFDTAGSRTRTYTFHTRADALRRNPVCNSSVMVRRKALQNIRLAMPQLFQYEDWVLWLALSQRGKFHYLPEPLVAYRVHENSATSRLLAEPLREVYSRIELCAAVMARIPNLRERARQELECAVADAVQIYGEEELVTGDTAIQVHPRRSRPWIRLRRLLGKIRRPGGRPETRPLPPQPAALEGTDRRVA